MAARQSSAGEVLDEIGTTGSRSMEWSGNLANQVDVLARGWKGSASGHVEAYSAEILMDLNSSSLICQLALLPM